MTDFELITLEPDADQLEGIVIPLCAEILPGVTTDYFLDRLDSIRRPHLILARLKGKNVGFKLGYELSGSVFFSWLGGVEPNSRRHGIASELMFAQHQAASANGYAHIETRARATNNAMIILNLKHGFQIIGFEIDVRNIPVVLQRKALSG